MEMREVIRSKSDHEDGALMVVLVSYNKKKKISLSLLFSPPTHIEERPGEVTVKRHQVPSILLCHPELR